MKRDLDLCRQLLADIEGHGTDCAVTALRPGASGEAEETIRYHVRLLIDAGFVKEVDRPQNGVPCVRLTNAGHEMLELSHSENRWREAKWLVGERTGTQSLTVIRSVLVRWATEATAAGEYARPRRRYLPTRSMIGYPATRYATSAYATAYPAPATRSYAYDATPRPHYHHIEPRYRFERDLEPTAAEPRFATTTTRHPYSYLERFDWRDAGERESYYRADSFYHREPLYREPRYRDVEASEVDGVTLPTHVV